MPLICDVPKPAGRVADAIPAGRVVVAAGAKLRARFVGVCDAMPGDAALPDAGLLVEAVFEDFNEYEGAEAIGSRSALWRCRVTPETRPLVRGEVEGPLYTSRPPRS